MHLKFASHICSSGDLFVAECVILIWGDLSVAALRRCDYKMQSVYVVVYAVLNDMIS